MRRVVRWIAAVVVLVFVAAFFAAVAAWPLSLIGVVVLTVAALLPFSPELVASIEHARNVCAMVWLGLTVLGVCIRAMSA